MNRIPRTKPYRFAALAIVGCVLAVLAVGALSVGIVIGAHVFAAAHTECQ